MPLTTLLEIGMHATQHGGVDRYYHGLVTELTRLGIPFRGFVFGESPELGLEVHSLGSPSMSGVMRFLRIRHEASSYSLAEGGLCLIATHFALYSFPILDLLKKCPHVVHFHGPWSGESAYEGQSRLVVSAKRLVERAVYSSAQKIIVLSLAFKELLIGQFGILPERIEVIPGGIDTDAFSPNGSRQEARKRLGWSKERPIVLCVRRLVQRMGLEQLIQAMEIVRRSQPDALLLIAGKGPLNGKLIRQIAALELTSHVRLLGFISDEDLPFAYRGADLTIVPSQALEGFGLIALESMAAGTPVLVTPVGGLPETVQGLSNRLILSGASTVDLSHGLIAALSGSLALPTEEDCSSYVRRAFDWSVIAPRVLDVYQRAMETPPN